MLLVRQLLCSQLLRLLGLELGTHLILLLCLRDMVRTLGIGIAIRTIQRQYHDVPARSRIGRRHGQNQPQGKHLQSKGSHAAFLHSKRNPAECGKDNKCAPRPAFSTLTGLHVRGPAASDDRGRPPGPAASDDRGRPPGPAANDDRRAQTLAANDSPAVRLMAHPADDDRRVRTPGYPPDGALPASTLAVACRSNVAAADTRRAHDSGHPSSCRRRRRRCQCQSWHRSSESEHSLPGRDSRCFSHRPTRGRGPPRHRTTGSRSSIPVRKSAHPPVPAPPAGIPPPARHAGSGVWPHSLPIARRKSLVPRPKPPQEHRQASDVSFCTPFGQCQRRMARVTSLHALTIY